MSSSPTNFVDRGLVMVSPVRETRLSYRYGPLPLMRTHKTPFNVSSHIIPLKQSVVTDTHGPNRSGEETGARVAGTKGSHRVADHVLRAGPARRSVGPWFGMVRPQVVLSLRLNQVNYGFLMLIDCIQTKYTYTKEEQNYVTISCVFIIIYPQHQPSRWV